MAIKTGIAWTDSTFNPWIGCTKIGPGCDNCYAEAADRRFHAGAHWGTGAPRKRTSEAYWRKPLQWNAALAKFRGIPGTGSADINPLAQHRVFCASQADVFDNEVDPQWRTDLWALIRATPRLTWQLVTKRVSNIEKMLPADWGDGYPNVWLLITVVNQEEADRDVPRLLRIPSTVLGLSVEPQIGLIDISPFHGIDWVICGGESAQFGKCRPFEIGWAWSLHRQCQEMGVAFFMKQLGSKARYNGSDLAGLYTGKGDNPEEWVGHWGINAREFPS